jgi:phosphatidylinositol glycan class B
MIAAFREALAKDTRLKLIFYGGLLVQLVFAVTSAGFHHPDQHFQLIELSSAQSGEPNGAYHIWEWTHFVRPTVQVYLFTGFHQSLKFIGISDPYTEMMILRIVMGISMFLVFNLLVFAYLKSERKTVLYVSLIILNFSWFLPYVRTLYSAEILASLFFFGTVLLYLRKKEDPTLGFLLLVGILLGFTFYIRFQASLFIAGFGVWLIWVQKKGKRLYPIIAGFLASCLFNILLDYFYYKELVITPYTYFYTNIIEGRASSFGKESVFFYIGILLAFIAAPFINLFLFYYGIKAYWKNYKHLIFISVAFFLVGHSIIAHKEDRFLFPVFNALPVVLGYGVADFLTYYKQCKKWIRWFLKGMIVFSVVLNSIVLILFAFTPFSQSVHYTMLLNKKFEKKNKPVKIYCYRRLPFETPSKAPLVYYKKAFSDVEIIRVTDKDSLQYITGPDNFLTATFNDIKKDLSYIDSLDYKPVLYSSRILWNINEFMSSRNMQSINDIWVLYKRE